MRFSRRIGVLIGATLVVITLGGCTNNNSTTEKTIEIVEDNGLSIEYNMDIVKRGTVISEAEIRCQYMQMQSEDCVFLVGKKVVDMVYVEKGDYVEKGQLLAQIENSDLESKLTDEKYALNRNQLLLNQTIELRDFDIAAAEEMYLYTAMKTQEKKDLEEKKEDIEKQYASTITGYQDAITINQLRIAEYEKQIEDGKLLAPMSGMVSYVKSSLDGSLTDTQETVVTIVDNSVCAFQSDNIEYKDYFMEGKSEIILLGVGDKQQEKEVKPYQMNSWDEEMYFELSEPDFEIEIGDQGSIRLVLDQKEDVLYVPVNALHQADHKYYVYTIDDTGLRNISYIEPGLMGNEAVEVISGLVEGQYVICK